MNLLKTKLPELTSSQARLANELALAISRKVFLLGQEIFLARAPAAIGDLSRVEGLFLGKPFSFLVSTSLIDMLLDPFELRVEDLSEDAMALFLLTHREQLPQGLKITSIASTIEQPSEHIFEVMLYANGKSSGHYVALNLEEDFPIGALVDSLAPRVKGVMANGLESVPISLPLVCAKLTVDSALLPNLAPGDLLLLGGAL